MSTRREIMNYIGTGAIGAIIGFYAGAQELLGIQSEETEVEPVSPPETPTNPNTPEDTPTNPNTPESSGENIFDDFEDSQLGWTVTDGDGSALTFVSESVHRSQSLYFENAPNEIKLEKQFNQPVQPSEFSLWFKYRSQRDNNFRYYLRDQDGNVLIEIREFAQTVHYKNRGGSGVTSEPVANINMDEWYQVNFSNVDFESQTLDIAVTDRSDAVVNSVTNIDFRNSVEQVNDVRLINSLEAQDGPGGATDPLWIDYITYKE